MFEYDLATNNSGYYGCGRFIRHLLAVIAALEASTAGDVKSSSTFFFPLRLLGLFEGGAFLDGWAPHQRPRCPEVSLRSTGQVNSFAGLASGTGGLKAEHLPPVGLYSFCNVNP